MSQSGLETISGVGKVGVLPFVPYTLPPTLVHRGIPSRVSKAKREQLTLVSREIGDAFAVVESHVPRTVGCEDLPASVTSRGSGASTAMSEAPALLSSKYFWLINPSSVSARLTVAAARCSGVRCSVIAARIWPTPAPSPSRTELLPSDEIETGQSESARSRTWRQSP